MSLRLKETINGNVSGNSGTATTLQTARTINGTSFNGSANITTANWGTARTITIGNTGKSVNGSANVSWSLSEIGAAATSHTHTSSQISDATNANTANMIVKRDSSGNFSAGTITASLSGNAKTATTLQTARTINGTSFNGSANITTANWGTARTITIGSTGKSVNGSANVSWSLSEIGAAAASHTHTSLLGTSLAGQTISLNTLNLSSGTPKFAVYFCPSDGDGANITGRPNDSAKNAFSLIVESLRFASTTDYITKQTYTQGNLKTMYIRYCTNGTWSAWEKVYTSVQKPTVSEIGAAASSHTHNYAGSSSAGGNANAAVKLATARTINGTSFDGSANITTANWGTARTITIGKTGKSVNGSANVSWSLSEIGAEEYQKLSAATAATAQWYRIAQTTLTDQNNTLGLFHITAACSGKHSTTLLNAGITYGQNPTIVQLAHTQYSVTGISKARIVYHTTYNGNRAYLEVYVPDAAARTITVQLAGTTGWTLVTPSTVGSIPSGYTHTEIALASNRLVGQLNGNATTATTLQTARTINGTSFNGSANITTANWGTARTLTIGSTGKSVNGSANVSWTLAEIGAAAASHTHTSSQISDATNANTANMIVKRDASGNFSAGTITAALSGNATTATTLKTARTINGTSFNGSANITTANWGTARTLTIGNTGKSVNGSANVSWTLAEIGAAAASHTHNSLTGVASGSGAISTTVAGTGQLKFLYNINKDVAGCMPAADNANALISVNRHQGAYECQLGFSSNGNLYYRSANGSAINSNTWWRQIWDERHIQVGLHSEAVSGFLTTHLENRTALAGGSVNDPELSSSHGIYQWGAFLSVGGPSSAMQLYSPHNGHRLYWRSKWFSDTARGWHEVLHTGNFTAISPAGNWRTNGNQDLIVHNKRALVGFTNGEFHLGYQGDFGNVICGGHFFPFYNTKTCGISGTRWAEVYCTRGAFNGSDSKLKENIKKVERPDTRLLSDNNELDFYNYVKGTSVYTFNYRNTKENFVGILADEIPDNIFNKIGIMSKTEEEYATELANKEKYKKLLEESAVLLMGKEEEDPIVKGTNLSYSQVRHEASKEIEEPVRLVNAPAQIAMLQEVLSIAINKIDASEARAIEMENEINLLRSEVSELKELVSKLLNK